MTCLRLILSRTCVYLLSVVFGCLDFVFVSRKSNNVTLSLLFFVLFKLFNAQGLYRSVFHTFRNSELDR